MQDVGQKKYQDSDQEGDPHQGWGIDNPMRPMLSEAITMGRKRKKGGGGGRMIQMPAITAHGQTPCA
jgi:hypothetical protein